MPNIAVTSRLATQSMADVTFAEALDVLAARPDSGAAVGFTYTPTAAPWFRRDGQTWVTQSGNPVPEGAFEVRAFTASAELRWWRTSGFDVGRAALLTEADPDENSSAPFRLRDDEESVLLWGKVTHAVDDGWANLAEGRIGDNLWVPVDSAAAGEQLRLFFVNYAESDRHGNVTVAEQRLVRVDTSSTRK